MSGSFSGSNYLTASPNVTNIPCTISTWIKNLSNSANQTSGGLTLTSSSNNYVEVAAFGTFGGDPCIARQRSTSANALAVGSTSYDTGAWFHCACVIASTTSVKIYANGSDEATSTTSVTLTNFDQQMIGAIERSSGVIQHCNGLVAEFALWDVALNATEIGYLANDLRSPVTVRASGLQAYHSMRSSVTTPEIGNTWTNNGTVTVSSDHPNVASITNIVAHQHRLRRAE